MTARAPSRRDLLQATLALPAFAAALPASARAAARPSRGPAADVELLVRMIGDTAGGRSYLQYDADVMCVADRQVPAVAFRVRGIARSEWSKLGPHRYHQRNFDHGLICDKDTGRVIERFRNPITGAENIPLHYRSGPFERDVSPVTAGGKPFALDLREAGGGVWFTDTGVGRRPNWLAREKWGDASTGDEVFLATSSTYLVERAFIDDRRRTALPATNFWTFVANYPPWMLMGERPGFVLWRWIARKCSRMADLDPYVVEQIEARLPGYFTADRPWTEHSNGWVQYGRERAPGGK